MEQRQDGVDAQRFRAAPPRLPSGDTAETVEAVATPAKAGDLPLQTEFNLVSLPVEPTSTNSADVLAGAPAGTSAWIWDACAAEAAWKQYTPGDPANELTSIDHRYGLWVKAPAAGGWTLPAGEQPTVTEVPVCPGWNLIGYPLAQPRPVPAALSSIAGKYLRVFGYDAFDAKDPWEVYDPNVPAWANDLLELQPGRGYWVLITEATTVRFANHGPPPQVALTSPLDLDEITAPVEVAAQIDSDLLQSWQLSYRPASLDDAGEWLPLAEGQTPTSGTLAAFDPTLLPNDLYQLRLTATDFAEQSSEQIISVAVDGGMKIGHFQLTFSDLRIPLSGLDLEVLRTYDSRDARLGRVGDFGPGWSMELRKGSVRHNRTPGEGWQIRAASLPCQQVVETQSHLTSVRLSDVEHYRFRLSLSLPATAAGGCFATAGFEYVDGPMPAQLEILDGTNVFYANETDHLVDADALEVYQPRQVRLVTRDGRLFELDLAEGVTRIEEANGNSLDFTNAGITHSSGIGVPFERDGEGRIVRITDPLGAHITYSYSASTGDLETVTDRLDQTARFTYADAPAHYLQGFEDPRGVQPLRNEYDEDGRLVRHIDAFGKVLELSHDLTARREVVTDRLGHARVLEYGARGNVVRETDALGAVTQRSFDERDNLLSETDALGNTTRYTYSAENDLLSVTDPLGGVTRFTYDTGGRVLTLTDARGKVTRSSYDAAGNLAQLIEPSGAVTQFVYDAAGNLESETDATGAITRFAYDARGNLVRQTDALGVETHFTYDGTGNQLSETTSRTLADGSTQSLVTAYRYDAEGRLVETTYADGAKTSSSYDALGLVTRSTDALGDATQYLYDALGRPTTTIYADGTRDGRSYDAEGRLLTLTDRAGRVTRFAYDAQGQLTSATYADGATTRNAYDAVGRPIRVTDARGFETAFTYDAAGQRTHVTDALGGATVFAYDSAGNRLSVTDANGNTTRFEYDDNSRLVRTVFPDGTSRSVGYDALGRRVSETDPAGKVTRFAYDPVGRLTSVTDALGQVTSYAYNEQHDRISQTDAKGHVTRFEYDALGRQTARILPDGARETLAYDAVGNLVASTDFLGRTTTYEHDALGRLVRKTLPGGAVVDTTYTPTDRRASVTDATGTTRYVHDARDRLVEQVSADGRRLSYEYDAAGLRTALTAHVGGQALTTRYAHDALGRLSTVTDPDGRVTSLGYDAVGNRVSLDPDNGTTTTYAYDDLHRLQQLETLTTDGSAVQSYAYTLGPAGNRTRIEEHDGTSRAYAYDDLYRLTAEAVTDTSSPVLDGAFQYDPVGNRLVRTTTTAEAEPVTVASTFDERDRLLTVDGQAFSWDANGNLTAKAGEVSFTWDPEDRLIAASLADGTSITYGYDPDGVLQRASVTLSDGTTESVEYLVDTSGPLSHVVAETDGAGQLSAYYVRGDDLLSVIRPDGVRHVHTDGLGSVRALTDETGAVTDRWTYSAFGELLEHVGSDPNRYLFAGEPRDPHTGLAYHRARWMDPGVGRFVGVDPFEGLFWIPSTLHRYTYCSSSPTGCLDPTGLSEYSVVGLTSTARINAQLRGRAIVAHVRVLRSVTTKLRKFDIRPFRYFRRPRPRNADVHHLIEKRLLRNNPHLRKIFRSEKDIPSIAVDKTVHAPWTQAWRTAFPYRNQVGHVVSPTARQVLDVALKVYRGQPAIQKELVRIFLPFL